MIAAIEAQGRPGYGGRMRSIVLQLLALVAVLLMPVGMAAPAAAAQHHGTSMAMQHCPDQGTKHHSKGAFAECTMACASALPAGERIQERPMPLEPALIVVATVHVLHGLHPDTATPPPKLS